MSIEGLKPLNDNTNSIFSYVLAFWLVQSTDLHRQDLVMSQLTKWNTWTHNLAAPPERNFLPNSPKKICRIGSAISQPFGSMPQTNTAQLTLWQEMGHRTAQRLQEDKGKHRYQDSKEAHRTPSNSASPRKLRKTRSQASKRNTINQAELKHFHCC